MGDRHPQLRRRIAVGAGMLSAGIMLAACGGATDAATPAAAPPTSSTPPAAGSRATPTGAPAPSASPAQGSAQAAGGPRVATGRPVTLAFGGDVHFEGSVRRRLDANPATVLEPVAGLLRTADIAMVNLETAVTQRGTAEPKQFTFRAPRSGFTALKAGGVDVVTVANNHGEDYGPVGLADTLDAARTAGFPLVGAGVDEASAYAPWRTTVNGQRVAVLGATQVLDDFAVDRWAAGPGKPGLASAKRTDVLLDAVRRARPGTDTLVVYLHWGVELQQCPNAVATGLARDLVAAGADVVVGSHAHVLLGSGYLGGAYVDYGLGNFVFYAGGGGPTTQSGVLTLTTRGRAVTEARWSPAVLRDGVTSPLAGDAATTAEAAHDRLRACTGLTAAP